MQALDWLVVVLYIGWIVVDGLRRSKGTDKVDGYFLANRSLPWWAVGLSVMATQMSAVTIVGTTVSDRITIASGRPKYIWTKRRPERYPCPVVQQIVTALICVAITDRPTAHHGSERLARK